VLAEWFYERTFSELLAFRMAFAEPEPPAPHRAPEVPLPRSARIAKLAEGPAFAPKFFREDDPELVRLDYGENEGPLPLPLVEGLIAAGVAPRADATQTGLAEAVAAFLLETRGARYAPEEVVVAPGVWPLVHHLGVAMRQRLGRAPRVFLVTPCYGVIPPTFEAAGCEVESGTLGALLSRRARGGAPDAVVLSQPANPTGHYMAHEELMALATYVVEQRCLWISDEIFGLMNLSNPTAETVHSPVTLEGAVPGIGARTVLLGGLSKEFAAGGLRVGWVASKDRGLLAALRESGPGILHTPTARASAYLYAAHARGPDGQLLYPARHKALRAYLTRMRRDLGEKRALIEAALPDDVRAEATEAGGLFLAPRMTAWLGKTVDGVKLTPENLPRVIYEHTHVVLNGGPWSGDPERVRAVFSIPRDKLLKARERLLAFGRKLR
jgi:aspartate/methionine/tyrosine aminotransferase